MKAILNGGKITLEPTLDDLQALYHALTNPDEPLSQQTQALQEDMTNTFMALIDTGLHTGLTITIETPPFKAEG